MLIDCVLGMANAHYRPQPLTMPTRRASQATSHSPAGALGSCGMTCYRYAGKRTGFVPHSRFVKSRAVLVRMPWAGETGECQSVKTNFSPPRSSPADAAPILSGPRQSDREPAAFGT